MKSATRSAGVKIQCLLQSAASGFAFGFQCRLHFFSFCGLFAAHFSPRVETRGNLADERESCGDQTGDDFIETNE